MDDPDALRAAVENSGSISTSGASGGQGGASSGGGGGGGGMVSSGGDRAGAGSNRVSVVELYKMPKSYR